MNYFQKLILSFSLAVSQSVSFRILGKYLITIVTTNGTVPNHLTFAQAWKTVQQILEHGPGTIQVGDVVLTITLL